MGRFSVFLKDLLKLEDVGRREAGESIRKNVHFRGANVFILTFAIIIASVGLNVNSIPVIIGAMLISPLMGPILGFGFGLAVRDNPLVRSSLKNFAVMVIISIAASCLFFLLSPLSLENPSELLARTNPSIYDVLIALFGGFAGILETSRKDKGTVLSGVAIATALMPPLCTVGYGLSILNWTYIGGALYLFLINSIFIALATYIGVKYLRYPVVENELDSKRRLSMRAVVIILIAIIVPSIFSAVRIVEENEFGIKADRFVAENRAIGKGFIYNYRKDLNSTPPVIELYMAGEALSESAREKLYKSAEKHGLTREQIVFCEDASTQSDMAYDAKTIMGIVEKNNLETVRLRDSIDRINSLLLPGAMLRASFEEVSEELFAQYPDIKEAYISEGGHFSPDSTLNAKGEIVVLIKGSRQLKADEKDRIRNWLKVRLDKENITISQF
ncbi:MAG: TIGR00341 family protein [Bacteroidales bacterium]|nr:TIGR00341 family protein [Bacteroidales bacterium]